jgi:hypothetical protein
LLLAGFFSSTGLPFHLMGFDRMLLSRGRLLLLFRGFLGFRLVLFAEDGSDFLD